MPRGPAGHVRDAMTLVVPLDVGGGDTPALVSVAQLLRVSRRANTEKATAPHSSALAWRTPGTGEPGGLPSVGSHRVGHD